MFLWIAYTADKTTSIAVTKINNWNAGSINSVTLAIIVSACTIKRKTTIPVKKSKIFAKVLFTGSGSWNSFLFCEKSPTITVCSFGASFIISTLRSITVVFVSFTTSFLKSLSRGISIFCSFNQGIFQYSACLYSTGRLFICFVAAKIIFSASFNCLPLSIRLWLFLPTCYSQPG